MAVSYDQLSQFNEFAKAFIHQADTNLTLDELWDQWRLENPTPDEMHEDVLAVKAAIADMQLGDRGMPVVEHIQQMRKKYDLPSDA